MDQLSKTGTGSPIETEKIRTYLQTLNLTTNLTPTEEKQFIEISQAFGLNPFKREIYASKYGNSFSIIVGFETYIKRAERSGRLSGWNVKTEGEINYSDVAKSRIRAIITIFRKDWSQPFVHEVYFEEYAQKTKDGYLNKFWREKPITMIKKVAMAQGFRLCFSDELGGLPYTSEEIGVFTESFDVTNESPSPAITIPSSPAISVSNPSEIPNSSIKKEKPKENKPKEKSLFSAKEKKRIEIENDSFSIPDESKIGEEFKFLSELIDKAESIDDLKDIYNQYSSWSKDGEFLGRLSIKRKEIESKEEELRRRKLEEPPIEVKMNLETLPSNTDGELF
jgi:phage recombination protein Bet